MGFTITKRDGSIALFDETKIYKAIESSFKKTEESIDILPLIVKNITDIISADPDKKWNVENIQDCVEKELVKHSYEAAKHYILYREERNEFRSKYGITLKDLDPIDTPWGEIGYITYKRTYSRDTEEFEDTIMRVLGACQTQLHCNFTRDELKLAREYLLKLKCSVAGRFLWQLGTPTVEKYGLASTQNCAFVVVDDPIRPFTWTFDMLMLGCGVGFNIQRKFVDLIPPLIDTDIEVTRKDEKDADFIVPDSREGWVKLLKNVLEAYFVTGESFSYSTILIRSRGTPIKGFGGVASGSEDLCIGIKNICDILKKRKGMKIRPIDCLDVMNIIGTIVVAGNVRRCLPKDSMVHTSIGLVEIQDVNVGDQVLTSSGYERVSSVFIQGKQKLLKIITESGEFICTPNHRMAVSKSATSYDWVMASDLTGEDYLVTSDIPIICENGSKEIENFEKYIGLSNIPVEIKRSHLDVRKAYISFMIEKDCYSSFIKEFQVLCYSCGISTRIEGDKLIIIHKNNTAKVIKIEYLLNEEYTYDIEVENKHEFFCQGYLTHNSAEISLGDPDDIEYLKAKRWDLGNIPNWRAMSNNSVVCSSIDELPEEFWEGYKGNGEPYGLVNIELAKKIGRIADGDKYPDPTVQGFNPCSEMQLSNFETCCLGEIFLQNVDSYDELVEIAKIIYRICKHSLLLPCHNKETEAIVHKNMRMGIGITGYLMVTEEKRQWLPKLYEALREHDIEYSKKIGCTTSIKLTTIKPSGCRPITALTTTQEGIYTLGEIMKDHPSDKEWHDVVDLNATLSDDKKEAITKSYRNGKAETVKITMSHDIEVQSTLNHKWWVGERGGWVEADNLKVGDVLEVIPGVYNKTTSTNYKMPKSNVTKPLTTDVAWCMGNSFNIMRNVTMPMNERINVINAIYGDEYCEIFRINDIYDSVDLPLFIRESSYTDIIAFIGGMANQGQITLHNEDFAKHVQNIALAVGLVFTKETKEKITLKISSQSAPKRLSIFKLYCPSCVLYYSEQVIGKIIRIDKIEEPVETYDIEVANEHWYYAGSIKSHNTLSLLSGATPGCHPAIYRYFIRRIRISASNMLVKKCQDHGFHTEYQMNFDGTYDYNTMVAEFPCCFPEEAVLAKDMTAIDELEVVKRLQTEWSDNAVSVTCYYRLEELEKIKDWLRENYTDSIKAVSFLLHHDSGFKQMPYEEITKEKYFEMKSKTTPIKSMKNIQDTIEDGECRGGMCPIK
jgi:hypothetical protein